jgi:TolB-like protein/DNA-binding winged helix-turn-helix (wHTH) protein/Flp pilus assembly protein TadD
MRKEEQLELREAFRNQFLIGFGNVRERRMPAPSRPAPSRKDRILRFDAFELDVRAGELRKRGVRQRLQGQPLQVLATLLKRPGDLVTREEIRDEIWPADTFVDFDHSLHNAIARIRETLGDSADAPRFIETLPRRGYRFIERVEGPPEVVAVPDRTRLEPDLRTIESLAVLPLDDHSGDPSHEYFADGMTEALITNLAKIKALRVISRTSAMQYKGVRKSLPLIARELNVDAVIEGSVLRSGDRVRITAQLIHAVTDQHLWAESYERDFQDILSLQREIARHIANEVRVTLTPLESARLGCARPVNPQAHEQYLMGRYHWNKRSEQGIRKALSHFQQAIEYDPTFAYGYAGLADSYNILGYYNATAPQDAYPKGRAAALTALTLDESLAEPHATLGVVKRDFEWDWAGADRAFQTAIETNPGYAAAYHWRSTLLSMLGKHDDAVAEKKKALAMDPLSVAITTDLARMFYFNHEYNRAIDQYRAALDMDPNFSSAHLWLAQAYEQKGMFAEAMSELEIGRSLSADSPYALARVAHGHAMSGKCDEAREMLRQLQALAPRKYVSAYDVAMIHVALQDRDEAFASLENAFGERSVGLGYLQVEPQLDPLRSDQRFRELVRRVGLPS